MGVIVEISSRLVTIGHVERVGVVRMRALLSVERGEARQGAGMRQGKGVLILDLSCSAFLFDLSDDLVLWDVMILINWDWDVVSGGFRDNAK